MTSQRCARRRHVFYIAGFDPNGPGRYHRLYSDGAKQQAALNGESIQVGPRVRQEHDTVAWTVQYRPRSAPDTEPAVETSYVFPRWDDIVRDYWWRDYGPQIRDLLATTLQYLVTGALWKMYRQSWGPFINALAPFLLLVALVPGIFAGLWAWWVLFQACSAGEPLEGPVAGVLVAAVLSGTWAYWARRHWHTQWILRSYAFVGRMGKGEGVPALEARLDAMAAAVCRQVREGGDDEVLVVGHSLGTIVAVSVLARAFRQDPLLARRGPSLGLVTLGHLTPLLSDLPAAQRFRDELALLARVPELCWVDFSDPTDAYSFAGVDPVAAAGIVAPRTGHPQVRSPGFLAGPSASGWGWRRARRNQHEIHAQYLCASPQAARYDYFAMTAGPMTLAQRFGGT